MSLEPSMVSYYADRAREYERIYRKPERQEDLQILRKGVAKKFEGRHVLEVACGTGYWTEVLASSAASVLATDISEEVLQVARSKSLDERVKFQRADAYALPRFPNSFSAGLSVFWWSHVPHSKLREFLRGFHGMLSPGANVMFIDNAYVEGSSTPISRTDENGDTFQIRRLDDGPTHEVRKNFPTESQLRSVVGEMGADVRVEFLPYYWVLSYSIHG